MNVSGTNESGIIPPSSDIHSDIANCSGNITSIFIKYGSSFGLEIEFTIKDILDKSNVPIWFILGLPGAVLSLIVWTRKSMRQSSSIYLAAMGFIDIFFFIFSFIFYLQTSWQVYMLNFPGVCQSFPVLYYFSQYMSPLLTLGFSVERYISICYPFQRDLLCSTARAIKVTVVLSVAGMCISSVQSFFYIVTFTEADDNNHIPGGYECRNRPELFDSTTWQYRFAFVWNLITELLIFGIVPISILLVNMFVIKELRAVAQRNPVKPFHDKSKSPATGAPSNASGGSQSAATTMMLLCVSFYFIIACLPYTLCQVIVQMVKEGSQCIREDEIATDPVWKNYFRFANVRSVLQCLATSHYAAKFYIYVATGKMFRVQLCALFKWCPRIPHRGQHTDSSPNKSNSIGFVKRTQRKPVKLSDHKGFHKNHIENELLAIPDNGSMTTSFLSTSSPQKLPAASASEQQCLLDKSANSRANITQSVDCEANGIVNGTFDLHNHSSTNASDGHI